VAALGTFYPFLRTFTLVIAVATLAKNLVLLLPSGFQAQLVRMQWNLLSTSRTGTHSRYAKPAILSEGTERRISLEFLTDQRGRAVGSFLGRLQTGLYGFSTRSS
jgi:hypothetical protein